MSLQWVGFAALRQGRIHVWCPKCHRRLSNVQRQPRDPLSAELVHCYCYRCASGCKDTPEYYFDGEGRRVND